MCERAAKLWECPVEKVVYEAGGLQHRVDTTRRLTFRQLAVRQLATGGPIMGRAGCQPCRARECSGHTYRGRRGRARDGQSPESCAITSVQDVGKAIHPSYAEGQIQGGTVQGIGWALSVPTVIVQR